MPTPPARATVDLSAYPDLVVMYLGMRVEEPRGAQTLQELGPQIQAAVEERCLARFAPTKRPQGPMLGARSRADADRASIGT